MQLYHGDFIANQGQSALSGRVILAGNTIKLYNTHMNAYMKKILAKPSKLIIR